MSPVQAEVFVRETLLKKGWKMPRLCDPHNLIKAAQKVDPKRVEKARAALENEGSSLYDLSAWDVVDCVFGLDFIGRDPKTGQLVGIDVTTHTVGSHWYHSKKVKQQHLSHLYSLLRLDKVIVFNPIEESTDSL